MAAFEIYANVGQPQGKTAIVHLFSKKLSGVWPHFSAVGSRAKRALQDSQSGEDLKELELRYTTKGRVDRNSGSPERTRNARFRATSNTVFSRFDQTGGSTNFRFAMDSKEELRGRDSSAPPALRNEASKFAATDPAQEEKKEAAAQ